MSYKFDSAGIRQSISVLIQSNYAEFKIHRCRATSTATAIDSVSALAVFADATALHSLVTVCKCGRAGDEDAFSPYRQPSDGIKAIIHPLHVNSDRHRGRSATSSVLLSMAVGESTSLTRPLPETADRAVATDVCQHNAVDVAADKCHRGRHFHRGLALLERAAYRRILLRRTLLLIVY